MKTLRPQQRLPALTAAGSFCLLLLLVFLTSPVKTVGWSVIFFGLLAIFLISLGHWLLGIRGQPSRRARQQVSVLGILLVLLVMFGSAQSLNWGDFSVLALTALAFILYIQRR